MRKMLELETHLERQNRLMAQMQRQMNAMGSHLIVLEEVLVINFGELKASRSRG